MKIEHIALFTKNLEAMRLFYESYFNGRAGQKYVNLEKGFSSYFISFGNGARLEIMNHPDISKTGNSSCTGYHHIAFSVGSP
ncbi:MAG: VOC family protein, partial [Spirochaetota bacterium]